MLTVYDKPATGSGLERRTGMDAIGPATVWIDLLDPLEGEIAAVESALGISIPTRDEMREIETSSRLYVENGATYMTALFISDATAPSVQKANVSFILVRDCLVSASYSEQKAFQLLQTRSSKGMTSCDTGSSVLAGILEAQVDNTADLIERFQDEVEKLTSKLFSVNGGSNSRDRRFEVVLRATGKVADVVASAQESALSLERLVSFYRDTQRRSEGDADLKEWSSTALRDIASLNEHMGFLTDRTTFLLSATLGMINTEQNQIIKLFSVMAVMLMPPTLVASVYGMNFRHMPELDWPWGYPAALGLMVLSAAVPFVYFRRKGWL